MGNLCCHKIDTTHTPLQQLPHHVQRRRILDPGFALESHGGRRDMTLREFLRSLDPDLETWTENSVSEDESQSDTTDNTL